MFDEKVKRWLQQLELLLKSKHSTHKHTNATTSNINCIAVVNNDLFLMVGCFWHHTIIKSNWETLYSVCY